MDELQVSRKKRARLLWTLEKGRYNYSNVPLGQRPARVVNYDEKAYVDIVLKREKVHLRCFKPTPPPPEGGVPVQLDPLPDLPPLEMESPISLQLDYMYYCDEALRRSVDPFGQPLTFDTDFLMDRLSTEREAFAFWNPNIEVISSKQPSGIWLVVRDQK